MATLTDTKARQIKPDDTPFPHGGITGLTLHPSSSKGHGKWVLRFISPVTKKRRNAGLGIFIADCIYPNLNQFSLITANGTWHTRWHTRKSHKQKIPTFSRDWDSKMAEEERFELSNGYPSTVFKTVAFSHSATPPQRAEL